MGTYWTVDLGATSRRVMTVALANDRVSMHEEIRFVNRPLERGGELCWDLEELWQQTLAGLQRAAGRAKDNGEAPAGVAVDSWGVDFALVDGSGVIGAARHYRSASAAAAARVTERVAAPELFRRSGVAPMAINTVFRLAAAVAELGPAAAGATMLLTPDLWTYRLGGTRAAELTIAGTTAMLDIATRTWDLDLLARLDIDPALLPAVAARIGTGTDVPVLRSAGHDTAAAVAAIPGAGDIAFISCGTWALAGVETAKPVLSEAALRGGFTNELGANGRLLFMRNLTGLWLLEQAFSSWRRSDPALSLDSLLAQAAARTELTSVIDVAAPALVQTLLDCERLTGVRATEVHMVGGGTRNALLCQLVADTCARRPGRGHQPRQRPDAGLGPGEVDSAQHLRQIVGNSYRPVSYYPAVDQTASGAPHAI